MFRIFSILVFAAFFSFNLAFLPKQIAAMPKASTASNTPTVAGTIVETMNASGYTYMLIESGAEKNWVAIPATTVEKGSTVNYYEGMVMKNFTSKTLNRTFDEVIFSSGLAGQKTETSQQTAPGDSFSAAVKAEKSGTTATTPAMETSSGSAGAIAPLEEISIEKATADCLPESGKGVSISHVLFSGEYDCSSFK